MSTILECASCGRDNDADRNERCWQCGSPIDLTQADFLNTVAVLDRFVAGDDEALPTPMMNLMQAREVAKERAERHLRWIKAVDELLASRGC